MPVGIPIGPDITSRHQQRQISKLFAIRGVTPMVASLTLSRQHDAHALDEFVPVTHRIPLRGCVCLDVERF